MTDLIYYLSCAVNLIAPDSATVGRTDLDGLFNEAKSHSICSAVCMALELAGMRPPIFEEAKNKAVRKTVLFDVEREKLLERFESRGIWYMPLKGILIKELYPKMGMREMADNDILYDRKREKEARAVMTENGYTLKDFDVENHDVYTKPPVLNFELHTGLFTKSFNERIYNYYKDPMNLMIKDEGNGFGYHLSDNEFYIYMTAHEYKHFICDGTGIRSLLDCYVYLKAKSEDLDFEYIEQQLEKLGIAGYERNRRELSLKIFAPGDPCLSEDEEKLLDQYLHFGTYGSFEHRVDKRIKEQYQKSGKRSKWQYMLRRIFPDPETMSMEVSFVKRYPVLYPAGVVVRLMRILTVKRGREQVMRELSILKDYEK